MKIKSEGKGRMEGEGRGAVNGRFRDREERVEDKEGRENERSVVGEERKLKKNEPMRGRNGKKEGAMEGPREHRSAGWRQEKRRRERAQDKEREMGDKK